MKNSIKIRTFIGGTFALASTLFFITTLIHVLLWRIQDWRVYGYPFNVYETWGPCAPGAVCQSFSLINLLLDLLLWSIIAAALMAGFYRMRARKNDSTADV